MQRGELCLPIPPSWLEILCFLIYKHFNIFIFIFLESEVILDCVFYFTILTGWYFESVAFSVLGCEHFENKRFILFAPILAHSSY